MGQASRRHQLAEAGGMDAVAAKLRGGGPDDPAPRFGGLELRLLHPAPLPLTRLLAALTGPPSLSFDCIRHLNPCRMPEVARPPPPRPLIAPGDRRPSSGSLPPRVCAACRRS